MSDKKKPQRPSTPTATMVAMLREKQGAPLMLSKGLEEGLGEAYAPAAAPNYVPPEPGFEPAPMPKNPATEIALLNQQQGTPLNPQAATTMLEEGIDSAYAPARAQTLSGMGPRFQQPPVRPKAPTEAIVAALRRPVSR